MNNNNKNNWMYIGGIKTLAKARLVIFTLAFGGYYFLKANGIIASAGLLWPDAVAVFGSVYALFSYYWANTTAVPERSHITATLFFDIAMVTAASVMLGPVGTALFPLYLMIVFGYGLPNGEYHLQVAAGLSSVAFSVAFIANPWWNDPVLAAGLLMSLFFLPLMVAHGQTREPALAELARNSDEEHTKAQALSELSQELHTQISEVITSSQGLLQQRNMSPQRKRLTRSIANSSASALRLVKEVDEYARLSSGQHEYHRHTTSLVSILDQISHQVTDEADKKQLNYEVVFKIAMLRPVEGCALEIKRVLEHLVFNAIKYTEKGYVRVTVKETGSVDSLRWRFEVSDSGVGIDEGEQATVFDPFVRAHAGRNHETRGIGLGATIARQLVDGMGGSIGMVSKANEGSTFWFEVPISEMKSEDNTVRTPARLSCLSLAPRERKMLDELQQQGLAHSVHVVVEDFPDQSSETANCLVVGESVANQQFLQVLDTVAQSHDTPPPVVRFQRLQPDDLVIYSRQRGGDIFFLPTTVKSAELRAMFAQCGGKSVARAEKPVRSSEKLSVLIADGSNVSRDILATMLVNRGHQIYMARSPIQALDILSGIKLDLLLLDPTLADDKVLAGIKHCVSKGSSLKCLLLADPSRPIPMSEMLQSHMEGQIPRPYQSSVVYKTIETLFGLTAKDDKPESVEPPGLRKMMFANDPALMDSSVLDELEQVDSGNILVNRFVQRYMARSQELLTSFNRACEKSDYASAIVAVEELANASEQIGLRQLAGYCLRLRTVQEKEFFKQSAGFSEEIGNLLDSSLDMLRSYTKKARRL